MIGIESRSGKWIVVLDRWDGDYPEGHVLERRPGRASIRTAWKIVPREKRRTLIPDTRSRFPAARPVILVALALERDLPKAVQRMIWNLYQEEGTKRGMRPAGWP
jgi:hypothetical protein